MHVHANYSQTLATLGAGRDEVQEIAARRAAEVRRRLAADKLLPPEVDDVAFVKASEALEPGPEGDTYSASSEQQPSEPAPEAPAEHGTLFSALA